MNLSGRKLVIVWTGLALAIGAIAALEYRDRMQAESVAEEEAKARFRWLVPAPLEELGAVEIAYSGQVHRFERDAKGIWFYHAAHQQPDPAEGHQADPGTAEHIEKALKAFARTRRERSFEFQAQSDEYGVVSPKMFVMVYKPGETQPLARYAIGHVAPDGLSRYVLVIGTPMVVTIANYQVENLLQLIDSVGDSAG